MEKILNKKVAIIYRSIPHYRRDFYNELRDSLKSKDITLVLLYGQPGKDEAKKKDTVDIDWAIKIENKILNIGRHEIYWQPVFNYLRDVDLVIVEQASKLLINYVLLFQNAIGVRKLAFWGHGKNFQTTSANRLAEWVKQKISTHVHWWFAYNDLSARVVSNLGFPSSRITSVQNAIDTKALTNALVTIKPESVEIVRKELNISSNNVAIYSGGMYPEKRLKFLIESLDHVKEMVPDFHMIFIGSGVDANIIEEEAQQKPWIHHLGPIFDQEKIPYFAISKLFLMPGLVGLGILDSFALETPLVTIDIPNHSPEIDYLKNNENGIMLDKNANEKEYANIVVRLLTHEEERLSLVAGCKHSRDTYTLERMVQNFSEGIVKALS